MPTPYGASSPKIGVPTPKICMAHYGQTVLAEWLLWKVSSWHRLECRCVYSVCSPESIKNRNDVFYLVPERSCVPDSPVWYSTMSLGIDAMTRMLNRLRPIREIQEAHLTAAQIPNPAAYYNWIDEDLSICRNRCQRPAWDFLMPVFRASCIVVIFDDRLVLEEYGYLAGQSVYRFLDSVSHGLLLMRFDWHVQYWQLEVQTCCVENSCCKSISVCLYAFVMQIRHVVENCKLTLLSTLSYWHQHCINARPSDLEIVLLCRVCFGVKMRTQMHLEVDV